MRATGSGSCCGKQSAAEHLSGSNTDHAHLLIRDRKNRRLGYLGTRLVNQIPGAQVIRPKLAQAWGARLAIGAGERGTLHYRERVTQGGVTGPPVVSRMGGRRRVEILDPTKIPE